MRPGQADLSSKSDAYAQMGAVSSFPRLYPVGRVAAAHSWVWGREGRFLCPGSLGGALGMGGDSQSRSACSPHILLLGGLYPLGM